MSLLRWSKLVDNPALRWGNGGISVVLISKLNGRLRNLWRGHCRRRNVLSAQKVNVAIIFNNMLGCEEAIQYMARNGIPDDVASRTLDHAQQRRKNDVSPLTPVALNGENAD